MHQDQQRVVAGALLPRPRDDEAGGVAASEEQLAGALEGDQPKNDEREAQGVRLTR